MKKPQIKLMVMHCDVDSSYPEYEMQVHMLINGKWQYMRLPSLLCATKEIAYGKMTRHAIYYKEQGHDVVVIKKLQSCHG